MRYQIVVELPVYVEADNPEEAQEAAIDEIRSFHPTGGSFNIVDVIEEAP